MILNWIGVSKGEKMISNPLHRAAEQELRNAERLIAWRKRYDGWLGQQACEYYPVDAINTPGLYRCDINNIEDWCRAGCPVRKI